MTTHRGMLHHMNIVVSDLKRSSPFYNAMFRALGYDLVGSSYDKINGYEEWKRWELDTPHEFSICQVRPDKASTQYVRQAVGHHEHIAFCALDREDVDRFYAEVLVSLEKEGHCEIEDPPCDCPEFGEGYYATFFFDPDGLKYEFVFNPGFLRKKAERKGVSETAER